jgi:carboxyl-terminal processing protease
MGIKNMRIRKTLAIVLSAVFILSFTFSGAYSDNSVLEQVRQLLRTQYVDELPDSVLNLPTVDEIIAEINKTDPHTKYFSAKDFTDFIDSIDNKFSGIGVQIEYVPEGVQIIAVFDGSPAKGAGMKAGDIIMMADSHILAGLPDNVAINYIKGLEGTSVNLKVKRGNELLNFDIVRKQISVPTVEGKILDNHIGYIRIVSFGADTATKFGEVLAEQQGKKADSYIIDLRNNGGGYLETALNIAGYFIGDNKALITKSKAEGEVEYPARNHKNVIDKPVIFLINEYSASASEVLSGAVKDYNKAYFLGVKSYGKGSVQITPQLENKDYLKMTIAKFYSPKGTEINKIGISPNMEVPDKVDSMKVAELILDSPKTITSTKGYVKVETNGKVATVNLARAIDQKFWPAYGQLIANATKQGKISIGNGNGKGWTVASKSYTEDMAKLYFPSYKLISKLKNFELNGKIKVRFDAKLAKNSLSAKNTELIDSESGERIAIDFKEYKDKEVTVVPQKGLGKAKKYYLVVHPSLVKADKKVLGTGILKELATIVK